MSSAPIGVFDSGVGGLTVARAIIDQLPREQVLYLGDTANGPYGPRPIAQVREHALAVMDELVDQGVKMLVIACNTASAAMFRDARERFEQGHGIPVVEVIQPAVRQAVRRTRTKRIGVIGTEGTINSRAYADAFVADPGIVLTQAAAPRFVEFVEAGVTSGPELFAAAEQYLAPLIAADIDTLVLGCTHYPLLAGAIQYVVGPEVSLVSSAEQTAYDVYGRLVAHSLLSDRQDAPRHVFEATGSDTDRFRQLAARFLGPEVTRVESFPTGAIPLPKGTP
ncbi:glutamate racemase [Microcella flavibacter]|uniref:glutamate racemase n=1 Tax=Microcella flavibacter TaxID=1804990 RepID=UPI00145672C8|nr:glutamate racemase [Microcella flavibacter]